MTLHFAIHGLCLIRKVKYRHWLGEADFCRINSFAFFRIFLAKNYNYIFEFVKFMSKVLSVIFFPGHGPENGIFQWRYNDVIITYCPASIDYTIFQSHRLSGWFMPSVMKICLNLAKLQLKYCRSLFSGHSIYLLLTYLMITVWSIIFYSYRKEWHQPGVPWLCWI